jgi:lysozyme
MSGPLAGLDVSHHQGEINWSAVAAAGYRFAFVKATEGTSSVDPVHSRNVAGALAAGLAVGSYHYAKPNLSDPRVQAAHLASTMGELGPGRLPGVLDLEESGDLSSRSLRVWMSAFLDELDHRTGRRSLLYTGLSFWRDKLDSYAGHPLWLARYNTTAGVAGWTFWQKSDAGAVPGIRGGVDIDVFDGDLAALDRLAGRGDSPAASDKASPHSQEDSEMRIVASTGKASLLFGVKAPFISLTPAEQKAWVAAGVPIKSLPGDQYADVLASVTK